MAHMIILHMNGWMEFFHRLHEKFVLVNIISYNILLNIVIFINVMNTIKDLFDRKNSKNKIFYSLFLV